MGLTNSKYISELSDDESDSELDYSLVARVENNLNGKQTQFEPNITSSGVEMPSEEISSNACDSICKGNQTQFEPDITSSGVEMPSEEISSNACNSICKDLTTDAAVQVRHFPNAEAIVTLDRVLEFEKVLDVYEIVSLVYLLYENAYCALQELQLLLQGAQKKLLYNWAVSEENSKSQWRKKLVEAICIIKNYKILKSLGYQKRDLIDNYMPHRANAITSISKVKKAVYLICEKLDMEKTSQFLQNVKLQLQKRSLPFESYNHEYLELYFLNWETLKFISLTDMGSIKKVLKIMGEDVLYDMLNEVLPEEVSSLKQMEPTLKFPSLPQKEEDINYTRKPSTSTDTHKRAEKLSPLMGITDDSLLPLVSFGQDNTSRTVDDNKYNIDPNNPGLVLIINQEHFYTDVNEEFKNLLPEDVKQYKLESREGTEKDKNDLKNIFQKFGFKVEIANNLTHQSMIHKINEVVKSVKDESSLIICIMSHGDRGVVYGSNSCYVKVNKIEDIMYRSNKEHLGNKPKILILQSCQGKNCQKLDEDSEEEYEGDYCMTTDGPKQALPRTVDMLTFWATVPGYAAIRNKRTGSWFIQALCQKMEQIGNRHHFADICTRIVNDVTSKTWIKQDDKNAMTPMVVSTLRRDFYLPPMRST